MPRLLHKNKYLTFQFLLLSLIISTNVQGQSELRIVFWNVENLFDIWDDSTKADDAFTPEGDYHWTMKRYRTKLSHLSQTIVALGDKGEGRLQMPILIGMAEVENDKVLRDLCRGTSLRRYHYNYIHYESVDRRGIDNALLYRSDQFRPYHSESINISDTANGFYTRDILQVEGVTLSGDSLIVIVNHFPSKRGGITADRRRMQIARELRRRMDDICADHPQAAVIVVGDFNASPSEPEIREGLMRREEDSTVTFVNLMETIPPGRGSYKYQDYWSCLDQIIVSKNLLDGRIPLQHTDTVGHIFAAPFMLLDDAKHLDQKIYRTFLGQRYQGGYSDHLPVYIDLKRQ